MALDINFGLLKNILKKLQNDFNMLFYIIFLWHDALHH
jgi:hypothetical protein